MFKRIEKIKENDSFGECLVVLLSEIEPIIKEAKNLAKKYKELTGKPLGITGEVAEFAAAKILGLELSLVRQPGYDAIRHANGKEIKIQIKGRCVLRNSKPGQRVGSIKLDKDWDIVILVLLDEEFEVLSMYEAERSEIKKALLVPGSKARNERGALGVSKFKSIGHLIWKRS
ncbi:MAG: hypothetical protein WDL87_09115 [Candidatus Omnitrophota bacterium]